MGLFLQLLANGLVQGAMVACLASGFGLVARSFRVFHVAMGAQFVFSSYAFYMAAVLLRLPPVGAVALALALSVLFALLLEVVVYRPFAARGCAGGVTMVASLGVLIVTENVMALAFGNEVRTIPHPALETLAFGSVRLTSLQVLQFAVCLVLFVAVGILIARSRWYKACWALGDEPDLARTMRLPVGRIRALVMATGALLVAVPALLVSADTGMDPHEGMRWLLVASMAAFFGGRDRYWAWGAGALAIGIAQVIAVWKLPAQWMDAVAFSLLLGVLAMRPNGLFGGERRLEAAT